MPRKVPHAAFCEEYDEDAHVILPDTRQVANVAAKRSRAELRLPEPLIDGASDSGYSSRTAATVNSTQSAPSGRKSPVPLKPDSTLKRADIERARQTASRKDRANQRNARPVRDEKMQVGTYPSAGHPAPHQRSPSKARRRESAHIRHCPGTCWDCEQGLYHPSTPVEPRPIDYPYYSSHSTPVHEFAQPPPSPQTPRYPPSVIQDVHVSHSSRPLARTNRSNSYHSNSRPVSYHGGIPGMNGMNGMMYNVPTHLSHYEHGPPPSSSAYSNAPSYPSSYSQQPHYYAGIPDFIPPAPPSDTYRERSESRSREPAPRRGSIYGPPVVDYDPPTPTEYDGEPLGRTSSREPRSRPSHGGYDRDEDYYRMPPPPLKHKAAPHIIQKRPDPPRKSATTASVTSERRSSRTFDMSDLDAALPDHHFRRLSRETMVPERSHSMRDTRRTTSYHQETRPSRIAIEGARRRRTSVYHYDGGEIEDKQREAEEYQAARSKPVPLTADALFKAKASSQRAESDSASQKSRSNSSRGSDARTRDGSNVGSKQDEDNNIVMTMNGVTMSFTQESAAGKRISVRTGETGQVELNIEGKRPKKYLTAGRSDYTGSSGRRELEDVRRPTIEDVRRPIEDLRRARDDRRERASRRSSRSTYSSRGFLD